MPHIHHDDSALARLIDDVAGELEAGRPVDWSFYDTRWPEYAEELRRLAPMLQSMVALGSERSSLTTLSADGTAENPTVLGDFCVLREVGRGGMGVVYEAEQISLGRRVALKVLPFAGMLDARQLQRFKNEARTAATLVHPHIVSVYSFGNERGLHYFAMQFIEGRSFAEIIQAAREQVAAKDQGGDGHSPATADSGIAPFDRAYFRRVAEWGIQVAKALDHAHQCGVVHRDVKPSNLLLDHEGKVWVADFGLATTARDTDLTLTGDLLGTLRYMSPEQIRGERGTVDPRTDIYSLGATLYELATLKQAFPARDRNDLLRQIESADPIAPRRIQARLPFDFQTIIRTAMHKQADSRYQTAEALAEDLTRFLEDRPIRARPARFLETAKVWVRRRPAWAALLSVIVVACFAGMGLQTWHGFSLQRLLAQTEDLRRDGLQRESELRLQLYAAHMTEASQFYRLDDLDRCRDLLDRYRDQIAGVHDPRGPEWRYLDRITRRPEPSWRLKHEADVLALAVSPDERLGVSADASGKVYVWNPQTGKLLREFPAHTGEARAAVFSPDGAWLATAGQDREIRIWDTTTWEIAQRRAGAHRRTIYALTYNRDGSLLVSGARDDGGLCVWNAADLSEKVKIRSELGTYSVRFSPNESELVSGHENNTLRYWSPNDGKMLRQKEYGGTTKLFALAVAPELETVIATGGDGAVRWLDSDGNESQHSAFHSPHGKYAVAWSAATQTILVGGGHGIVAQWRLGSPLFGDMHFGRRRLGDAQISSVATVDGGFLIGGRDGTVALYDERELPADLTRTLATGRGAVIAAALSPDGRRLAAAKIESPAVVLDLETGAQIRLAGKVAQETRLEFSALDQSLVGLDEQGVAVWNADGTLRRQYAPASGSAVDFALCADGRTLAVASAGGPNGSLEVFDLVDNAGRLTLPCAGRPVRIRRSPTANLLAISYEDERLEFVDLTRSPVERKFVQAPLCRWIEFSPDGKKLACASGNHNQTILIDVTAMSVSRSVVSSGGGTRDLAWSPDGRMLAVTVDADWCDLWHVPTGRLLHQFYLPPPAVPRFVRFSPDGQTLALTHHFCDSRVEAIVTLFLLDDRRSEKKP